MATCTRPARIATTLLLTAALTLGCGDDSPAPAPVPSTAPPATGSPATTPEVDPEVGPEQLDALPPSDAEVAALLDVDPADLRSSPNEGVSQRLEGVEVSADLAYAGHSYSAGDPRRGGPFVAVGLLSVVSTEQEVSELYATLTDGDYAPVEVAGASEAAASFDDLPSEGFALDALVVRRDTLLLFLTLLSPTGGPGRGAEAAELAELVIGNALAAVADDPTR